MEINVNVVREKEIIKMNYTQIKKEIEQEIREQEDCENNINVLEELGIQCL